MKIYIGKSYIPIKRTKIIQMKADMMADKIKNLAFMTT